MRQRQSGTLLDRAGIESADVLVASTHLEEVNIVCCAVPRTFCFISREEFIGLDPRSDLNPFGIDRLVWPEDS